MEILNKTTIKGKPRIPKGNYLRLNKDKISFSKNAVDTFKLELGKFIHFIIDEKQWFFIVNTDDNGYGIKKHGSTIVITSVPVLREIIKRLKCEENSKFYLQKSKRIFDGSKTLYGNQIMIEILINKSIKQLKDS